MSYRFTPRRGASLLEMLGCVIALAAGLTLGAQYLGVDLKGICASALKSADVEAPEWLADAEQAIEVEGNTASAAANETAPDVALQGEQASPPDLQPKTPITVEDARQRRRDSLGYLVPLTDEQKAVLTLAYWDDLLVIIDGEAASRRACIDDACNLQLFDYLSGRRDAHQAAAEAIAELDVDGVDPHVMAYSDRVRTWHEEGAHLFGRAIDLLTDAPTAQLTGPFAQSWQSAATQHRMEERLLSEKQAAVRSFLKHHLPNAPQTAPEAESAATAVADPAVD